MLYVNLYQCRDHIFYIYASLCAKPPCSASFTVWLKTTDMSYTTIIQPQPFNVAAQMYKIYFNKPFADWLQQLGTLYLYEVRLIHPDMVLRGIYLLPMLQ